MIIDKFTIIAETSPVNSTFLKNNLLFVILKVVFICIERLCYSRT